MNVDRLIKNTYPSGQTQSHDTCFQDKSFKGLRVTGRCLHSLIASIFYKIIAGSCWVLRLNDAKLKYNALASYHFERASSAVFAYSIYEKNLINFGVNSSGPLQEPHNLDDKPLEKLTAMYGDKFETWFNNTPSVNEKKLHVIDDGICYGISVDYISRYLNVVDNRTEPLDAIKEISSFYTEKGTQEAQMLQILYEAQDQSPKVSETKHPVREGMSFEEMMTALKEAEKQRERDAVPLLAFQNPAKNLNLDLDFTTSVSKTNGVSSLKFQVTLKETLKSLKPGAYLLATTSAGAVSGHMNVFIKVSDDETYFHNPYFGTSRLTVTEVATKTTKSLEMFDIQAKDKKLYFFKCQLNDI